MTLDRVADFADTTLLAVPASLWFFVALKWWACFTVFTGLCEAMRVVRMARECLLDFDLLALTVLEGADLPMVVDGAAVTGLVSLAAGAWAMTGAASIEAAMRAMATLRNMELPFGEVARVFASERWACRPARDRSCRHHAPAALNSS